MEIAVSLHQDKDVNDISICQLTTMDVGQTEV